MDLLDINNEILFDGLNILRGTQKRLFLSGNTIHGYEKKTLIYGDYKFIYSKGDDIAWIFNLKRDPMEQHPIVDEELTKMFIEKLLKVTSEKLLLWNI